jgi:hypothetical protein
VANKLVALGRLSVMTHVLDLIKESVLDQTLVEKESVVIDNIDEIGAGRSA